ncbi:MAG: hypothetical protein FWE67_10700 [Planctomycetaceae bacterium]|nr:hypothetical protein [Planctomycetaceae bacterium]
MRLIVLSLSFLLFTTAAFAAPLAVSIDKQEQIEQYLLNAVPNAENFVKRLVKDGEAKPWDNLGVRSLIENSTIIVFANFCLPEDKRPNLRQILPLLQLAEEMQDKNPESRTFGNFRWYWRTPEVTDRNAVEFVSNLTIPIWLECKELLPPEIKTVLERLMQRSVDGCINHNVRPDYTNIALYNTVHLILLGQIFDRPDAIKEGEKRLQALLFHFWDHGIFEYNSPTYYTVDLSALQLGNRYVKSESTRQALQTLLELFYTDLTLTWYTPSQRLGGPQSRTYNYLYGTGGISLYAGSIGLCPLNPKETGIERLNVILGNYKPKANIAKLNNTYPRLINQRWGGNYSQWFTLYVLKDIALGTSGAAYRGARQHMPLTVDLADFETIPAELQTQLLPRNYFIADGREDPYGNKKYPTSTAGHQKALHMEAFWLGAQRTVDALGLSIHTPETLNDPVLTNVQSHFVLRKPDAVFINGKKTDITSTPVLLENNAAVLKYGQRAIGIRVPWTRDKDGQSPSAYFVDDGNTFGVIRLTVDHWGHFDMQDRPPVSYDGLKAPTGAAIWVRIGSQHETERQFTDFCVKFASAKIEELNVNGANVSIRVEGVDGSVAVKGTGLDNTGNQKGKVGSFTVSVEPEIMENGILEVNGIEIGRPLLELIPKIAVYSAGTQVHEPVKIDAEGTYWEAEDGVSFSDDLVLKDENASGGKAVIINSEYRWDLDIAEDGEYYLWARVFAFDPESDSFFVSIAEKRENSRRSVGQELGDWHIGSGKDWRWVSFKIGPSAKAALPLHLQKGQWQLFLRPREINGRVDKLFLTKDPKAKPE